MDFHDLEESAKVDQGWTRNLLFVFFSAPRGLGGLGIAESAKSFSAPPSLQSAKSHLSTRLNTHNRPSTHTHGSHERPAPSTRSSRSQCTQVRATHRGLAAPASGRLVLQVPLHTSGQPQLHYSSCTSLRLVPGVALLRQQLVLPLISRLACGRSATLIHVSLVLVTAARTP